MTATATENATIILTEALLKQRLTQLDSVHAIGRALSQAATVEEAERIVRASTLHSIGLAAVLEEALAALQPQPGRSGVVRPPVTARDVAEHASERLRHFASQPERSTNPEGNLLDRGRLAGWGLLLALATDALRPR